MLKKKKTKEKKETLDKGNQSVSRFKQFVWCRGPNVCDHPPPKFMCWGPNPQCDDIWRGGMWEIELEEVRRQNLPDEISSLIRINTRKLDGFLSAV